MLCDYKEASDLAKLTMKEFNGLQKEVEEMNKRYTEREREAERLANYYERQLASYQVGPGLSSGGGDTPRSGGSAGTLTFDDEEEGTLTMEDEDEDMGDAESLCRSEAAAAGVGVVGFGHDDVSAREGSQTQAGIVGLMSMSGGMEPELDEF
eukprot:COSAG05_NODE_1143_length_5736_cov_9.876885_3_plen_152_part_00